MKNNESPMKQNGMPRDEEPKRDRKNKLGEIFAATIGILYIGAAIFAPFLFGYLLFIGITSRSYAILQLFPMFLLFFLSLAQLFFVVVLIIVPICRWMREERRSSQDINEPTKRD